MNKEKFDEMLDIKLGFFIANLRAGGISESEIERGVSNIIDKYNKYYDSHRKVLIELLGQTKVTNRDNKFAEYSFEDITKKLKNYNPCFSTRQENDDHVYFVIMHRIGVEIVHLEIQEFGRY